MRNICPTCVERGKRTPAINVLQYIAEALEADIAILEYETVIELDRNEAGAYANLGWCKLLIGSIEEAIPAPERALRLSPRDNRGGNWCARIALVPLLRSHPDEAILWLKKGGQRQSGATVRSRLPCLCLWPKGRDRTCRRRTRRGPQATRR